MIIKNEEKVNIKISNEDQNFQKIFSAEKTGFKNIPSGQYELEINNKVSKYDYKPEKTNVKIVPKSNQILVKKILSNRIRLEVDQNTEELKTKN